MSARRRKVTAHSEMNPSCRATMEDAHSILNEFNSVDTDSYYAVFDGHGGRDIVDFVSERLGKNVAEELSFMKKSKSNVLTSVTQALVSAFLITDVESAKANLLVSGSTAAVCLVVKEGENFVLYAANVGDTRAVLGRGADAVRITTDHKAGDPVEVKRIERAGGFVMRKRVLGILSVTRSFGDHGLKKFVLARPYTSRTVLRIDEDDLLIIACDGVWDVMEDQEALDLARSELRKDPSADVARKIVHEALERGTTDNVTCVVVQL